MVLTATKEGTQVVLPGADMRRVATSASTKSRQQEESGREKREGRGEERNQSCEHRNGKSRMSSDKKSKKSKRTGRNRKKSTSLLCPEIVLV